MEIDVNIAHWWGIFIGTECVAVFKFKAEALNYIEERPDFALTLSQIERKS